MKFLLLLTALLTIVSCDKAWESCGGAEYTASVEETENIFKAESSSYDGFHCPVMEEAWPGTDSKEFVEDIIGTYKVDTTAYVHYPEKGRMNAYYEKIALDDVEFERLGLWREFVIESLLSCEVGVAPSGSECLDTFELVFKGDKATFRFAPLEKPWFDLTYSGYVKQDNVGVMYGPDTVYIDDVKIEIDSPFVLRFNVEGEEYDSMILAYDKD